MDGHNLRILLVELAVDPDHGIPQVRILLILPGGIIAHGREFRVIEFRQLCQLIQQIPLFLIHRAADSGSHGQSLFHTQNAPVQAGLHQAFDVLAPALDTVGCGIQQRNDLGSAFRGQCIAAKGVQIIAVDPCFGLVKLLPQFLLERIRHIIDPLGVHTQHNQADGGRSGNGVVLCAAFQLGDAERHDLLHSAQQLTHHLVGIGPLLVDLHAGVAALKAFHRQLDAGTIDHSALQRQADGGSCATSAGNREDTLFLGVQIQHGASFQPGKIDAGSAEHTGLLIHGDDDFQRRMGNGLIGQNGHGISHSDAVIAAQGSTTGENIGAVMGHIQALSLHIDGAIRILVTDHVHVALQDHRGMILVAAGTFLIEDHIIQFILLVTDAVFLRKRHQIVADGLGIAGTMGIRAEFFKESKNGCRLQTGQLNSIHSVRSF